MDPLLAIADAVVADLDSVKGELGVPFDVERGYAPTWDPAEKPRVANEKAQVVVAGTAVESELSSRSEAEHNATIQIVAGAWTLTSREAADGIVGLLGAIASRYLQQDKRAVGYATGKEALITAAVRVAVYDVEQFRQGLTIGAVNLTVRYWDSI